MKEIFLRIFRYIILLYQVSGKAECTTSIPFSNVLTNDFRIADICSDLSKWNIVVSTTADRISNVCDAVLKVQLQQKVKGSSETEVKNINYTLHFLLSTISDEISEMEDDTLKVNKAPPGTVILYSHDSSTDSKIDNQNIRLVNATEIQFDLRNTPLVLPSSTCGQMFLIAALWNHSSINNKFLVTKQAWPFQVICETAIVVDLSLQVELKPFALSNGIFSNNNMTLIYGIPISQQLLGLKIYMANAEDSQTSFLRRTNPSLPKVMVYITPRKHSLLIKNAVSYKTLQYRLGDQILHREQLIGLEFDYSSPEEKTYLPLRGNEIIVPEILDKFRMVQLEQNRLIKRNQCPSNIELRTNFEATLFGQLYSFIQLLNERWVPTNQSEQQKSQKEQILLVSQALGGLLVASTSYNSVPAYFTDVVLNGLFTFWPFFPLDISYIQSSSTPDPKSYPSIGWHERLAKVVTHFMRKSIYADYEGKPNPDTGLQNFLNQLLWSPDTLEGPSLSKDSVHKLRQFLLMVLKKKLPTTFDNLPPEILNSLSFFYAELTSLVPINEDQVKIAIDTVFEAVQKSITVNRNLIRGDKNDPSNNQEYVFNKLTVLTSFIEAINTPSIITRLTLIVQKIQESVSLNKQWILKEGMSDTAIDAELYCRLHALNRILFHQNPKAENLFDKLNQITFWKRDSGVIYRGDISSITGRLYWNRVAVCHCDGFSSTKYHSRDSL